MRDKTKPIFIKVTTEIESTIKENELFDQESSILVALSGGPDSMCLIDALIFLSKKYKFKIMACHVNHLLRGVNSDSDMNFVDNYCKSQGIKIYHKSVDVMAYSNINKRSIEESARILRYEFLDEIARKKGAIIATAHHMQDQTETVMMNIIRGTGTLGLGGMEYKANNIIRPLLNISKTDIMEYLKEQNVEYCIDETNMQESATRNKIRLKIIPIFEEYFGKSIHEKIKRTAFLCKEDEKYIKNNVLEIIKNNKITDSIPCDLLNSLPFAISSRIIRLMYENAKGDMKNLSFKHTSDLLELSQNNINGKKIDISDGFMGEIDNGRLIIIQSKLYLSKINGIINLNEKIKETFMPFNVPGKIEIKDLDLEVLTGFVENDDDLVYNAKTWFLPYDAVKGSYFRFRKEKDIIRPNKNSGTKTLKKFLIEKKVPKQARDNLLILANGNEVLWIFGMDAVSYNYKKNEKKVFIKVKENVN